MFLHYSIFLVRQTTLLKYISNFQWHRNTADKTDPAADTDTLTAVIRRNKENQLPPAIVPFFPYRNELTVEEVVIMKGH